jgi:hypothetical protein
MRCFVIVTVDTKGNIMNKLIVMFVLSLVAFGCASQQVKPEVPAAHPCVACLEYAKQNSKELATKTKIITATGVVVAIEFADIVMWYLCSLEKDLQVEIQEFKNNHPALIEETELRLRKVRDMIAKHKAQLMESIGK